MNSKAEQVGGEVTNKTKLSDFSFRSDHSVQPSMFCVFRVLERPDNRVQTLRASALEHTCAELSGYFHAASREVFKCEMFQI